MGYIKRFQQGGPMPEGEPQGQPAGPQDVQAAGQDEQMMQQLAQLAQQLLQELGPEAAAMLAQIIMEILQGAQQEVGGQPQGEVGFQRKGGKICKKACGGAKMPKRK